MKRFLSQIDIWAVLVTLLLLLLLLLLTFEIWAPHGTGHY